MGFPNISEQKKRYYFLDSVRGICILGMIAYHILFDFIVFFNAYAPPAAISATEIIRDFGAACFIFISGICIHFGERPVKRALILSLAGLIITLITYIFVPDTHIVFGILTFMGLSGFIMLGLKKIFDPIPPVFGAAVSLFLFLLTFRVPRGYIGYCGAALFRLPDFLYKNYFTALFGFPFNGFFSGDYFPIFPWIFMVFFGFFFWNFVKDKAFTEKILNIRIKFLEKIGNYSLYIYILHQPVILGLIYLIDLLVDTADGRIKFF